MQLRDAIGNQGRLPGAAGGSECSIDGCHCHHCDAAVVTNQIAIHPALFVADVTRFLDAEVPFPIQPFRISITSELAESRPSGASTCHPRSWRGRAFSTIAAKRIRLDC